jgi:protein-tyrosine phosphatase
VVIQEFTSGGELYIGGIEAAKEATEGANTLRIDCICECRDGSSQQQDRGHVPHTVRTVAGMVHLKIPATRLMYWDTSPSGKNITDAYTPLFDALLQGRKVLVHCKNGRHRSAQVCGAVMTTVMGVDVEQAQNYIWMRRRIVEFHVLPGHPS